MAPHRTSKKALKLCWELRLNSWRHLRQHLHSVLLFRCGHLTCIASCRIGLRFPQRRF